MKRTIFPITLFVFLVLVFSPVIAFASGGGDEFQPLSEKFMGWIKGNLGLTVLAASVIVAVIAMVGGALRALAAPIIIAITLGFVVDILVKISTTGGMTVPW